jgi:type I restriction enzyme S subunit
MMAATTNEWPLRRLKDITSKIGSGATPRGGKNAYRSEGISLIRSLNVYDFKFTHENLAFIGDEQAAKLDNVSVHKADILLNITGASVARCCMVDPKFLPARVNQHVAIVRVRPDVADAKFVFYCINSPHFKSRLFALAQGGATREALTKTTIEEFEVVQPPLPVQQRIGSILSAYDELIENSQRRIRILGAMARALYREWFVQFRFPGHENHPRVPSPLGEIPEGWEVKKLGDVLELNYGKALKKADRRGGPFPVYGSSGVVGTHDACLVDGPGIIVGRKGNVGSVFWCNDNFFVIDTAYYVTSSLPLHYLYYVLPTLNFLNSDAAVPGLSRNQAYTLEIQVPPTPLLAKFCDLAGTFERQASTLQNQIENLRRTRDLLLPRLLSGQLELEVA